MVLKVGMVWMEGLNVFPLIFQSQVSPPTKSKSGVAVFTDLDSALPDILPVPTQDMIKAAASIVALPGTSGECMFWKSRVKVEQPISTYLSVTAKGIK